MGKLILRFLGRVVSVVVTLVLALTAGAPGLAAGVLGGIVIPFGVGLARRRRRARAKPVRVSLPMRWRPHASISSLVGGLVGSLGVAGLMQGYGRALFDGAAIVRSAVTGLVAGVAIPSLIWFIVVRRVNARAAGRPLPVAGRLTLLTLVMAGAGMLLASPANAVLTGPCTAIFNGRNVRGLTATDPDSAMLLRNEDVIDVTVGARVEVVYSSFSLEYGGESWVVFSGEGRKDAGRGSRSFLDDLSLGVRVGDFTKMAVGLFRISGEAGLESGQICDGALLVRVEGDPLATAAGAVDAMAAVGGALAVAGKSLRDGIDVYGGIADRLLDPSLTMDDYLAQVDAGYRPSDGSMLAILPIEELFKRFEGISAGEAPSPSVKAERMVQTLREEMRRRLGPERAAEADALEPALAEMEAFLAGSVPEMTIQPKDVTPFAKHPLLREIRMAPGRIEADLVAGQVRVVPRARDGKIYVDVEIDETAGKAMDAVEFARQMAGEKGPGLLERAATEIEGRLQRVNDLLGRLGRRIDSVRVGPEGITISSGAE